MKNKIKSISKFCKDNKQLTKLVFKNTGGLVLAIFVLIAVLILGIVGIVPTVISMKYGMVTNVILMLLLVAISYLSIKTTSELILPLIKCIMLMKVFFILATSYGIDGVNKVKVEYINKEKK